MQKAKYAGSHTELNRMYGVQVIKRSSQKVQKRRSSIKVSWERSTAPSALVTACVQPVMQPQHKSALFACVIDMCCRISSTYSLH